MSGTQDNCCRISFLDLISKCNKDQRCYLGLFYSGFGSTRLQGVSSDPWASSTLVQTTLSAGPLLPWGNCEESQAAVTGHFLAGPGPDRPSQLKALLP